MAVESMPNAILSTKPNIAVLRAQTQYKGVIHHHAKPRSRELFDLTRRELGCIADKVVFQCGVIPPIGGNGAEFARHVSFLFRVLARIFG